MVLLFSSSREKLRRSIHYNITCVLRILYKLLVGNSVWKREAQNTNICRSEWVGHLSLYLSGVKRGWNSYITVNNWRSLSNHIGVGHICCKITVCFIFAFKSKGLKMKPSLFQILISPLNLKLTRDPEAFTSHEVIGWLQNSLVLHSENSARSHWKCYAVSRLVCCVDI